MRKSERINMLELELYKMRIELDLIHEIIGNLISAQAAQQENVKSMDAGKWYPRRLPPQN
jgi:hypothetical protein